MTQTVNLDRHQTATRRAAVVCLFAGAFGAAWILASHFTFHTNTFDSGVIDNVLWKFSHGLGDVSAINGTHLFADHFSPIWILALPLYWFLPSAALPALLVAQAASAALGGWATWLVTEHFKLDRLVAWVLLAAVLAGPGFFFVYASELHATGLALGPLAMAIAYGLRGGRFGSFAVWATLAALARPEMAAAVAITGLLLRRSERPRHARFALWVGGTLAVIGTLWTLLTPLGGASFSGHLGHLGNTPFEVMRTAITQPWKLLEPVAQPWAWLSIAFWMGTFGVLAPWRGRRWLLVALPLLIVPLVGVWPPADPYWEHYWHIMIVAGMVAAAEGLASDGSVAREFVKVTPMAIVALWAVAIVLLARPYPVPVPRADHEAARQALQTVSELKEDSVSVPAWLLPHLSHRDEVMPFPLPFDCPSGPVAGYRAPERLPDTVITHARLDKEWYEVLPDLGYRIADDFGAYAVWLSTGPVAPAPALACGDA